MEANAMSENNNEVMTEGVTETVETPVSDNIECETREEVTVEAVAEAEELPPPVMEGESLAAKYEELDAKNKKWKNFWDKVTTGILIFLMASPFLILGYIFYWFMTK